MFINPRSTATDLAGREGGKEAGREGGSKEAGREGGLGSTLPDLQRERVALVHTVLEMHR